MKTGFIVVLTATLIAAIAAVCYAHCPTSFTPPPCVAQTFRWIEREEEGDFMARVPAGPGSINLGDIISYRGSLFLASNGVEIGKTQGLCTLVDITDDYSTFTHQCSYGFYLGSSSIQVSGQAILSNVTRTDVLAITGGTGRFAGANGIVTQESIPPPTPGPYTFRHTVQLLTGFDCRCD